MLFSAICFISFCVVSSVVECNIIVETELGLIRGTFQNSYRGRIYSAFEGIPYAKPPIGKLRFREPQPVDKWHNILNANTQYMCMNFFPYPDLWGVRGHEDCLYLYVYVPRQEINQNENLDVVVHIHGGAFMMGSPKLYAGPDYIMDKDVVFVTMNYRLGILGFLSTEDEIVPGNNGLKDQVLALKWIKNHIKHFGGNPNSITLTGLFSGGSSVHYHYLSPLSRGLFNRGFSQSGTALQSTALVEEPLANAQYVALRLGCPTYPTIRMVDCLRTKPARKLVFAVTSLFVLIDAIPVTPFGPVIENGPNPFLADHPYKLMSEGEIYDVPWISSNAQHEGIFPVALLVLLNRLKELDEHWNNLIPYALDFNRTVDSAMKDEVSMEIRNYYFNHLHVNQIHDDILVGVFSDRIFYDTEKALRLQSQNTNSSVYYYFFTYELEEKMFVSEMVKGVSHTDDGKLFLRMAHTPKFLSKKDEIMMTYFIDFIANYSATGVATFHNIDWKPIKPTADEIDFLHIDSPEQIWMASKEELAPTQFWDSLPIMENDKLFIK